MYPVRTHALRLGTRVRHRASGGTRRPGRRSSSHPSFGIDSRRGAAGRHCRPSFFAAEEAAFKVRSGVRSREALYSLNTVSQAQPPLTYTCPNNGACCSLCECHKCTFFESNKGFVLFSKHHESIKSGRESVAVPSRHARGRQPLPHSTGGQSTDCSSLSVARMRSLTVGRENCCHRLPLTVQGPAASLSLCNTHSCSRGSSSSAEGRNKQLVEQESDTSCSRFGNEQRLVQPLFRCSEKRRRAPSYPRLASVKQIPTNLQVQDANTQTATGRNQTGRLVYNYRSDRCLLSRSNSSGPQAVSKVCIRGHSLRIPGAAVRLITRPRTFTKCVEAALAPLRKKGVRI